MAVAQLFLSAILASTIGLKATSADYSLLGDVLANVSLVDFPPASQASENEYGEVVQTNYTLYGAKATSESYLMCFHVQVSYNAGDGVSLRRGETVIEPRRYAYSPSSFTYTGGNIYYHRGYPAQSSASSTISSKIGLSWTLDFETENKAKLEGVLDILRWSLTVKRTISNALSFEYEKTVTVTREEPILSTGVHGASQGYDDPFVWAHIFQSPIKHLYYLSDYYYFFELDDDSTWRGGTNGVSFRVMSTMETSGGSVVLDAYPSFRFSTPN